MKKNRFVFCIVPIIWVCFGYNAFAQSTASQGETARQETSRQEPSSMIYGNRSYQGASTTDADQNTLLARSSADYRVTPGDVYTLVYAAGLTPVSYIITVDSSYRIRVSNLGIVNGAGKTFMQLKNEVETVVANNYPLSGVQLVLTQPAVFRVYINGEVHEAKEVSTWGLSRLSTLLEKDIYEKELANRDISLNSSNGQIQIQVYENLTDYTSIRDISVKSSNGQTRVYDLFKAQRLGDLSQNPYLRPGDVITFNRISRVVTINGEVERPGTYQIVEGENLKELIGIYAGGFTELADNTRMELVRLINSTDIAGNKIYLTEDDIANNYALEHYDAITVPDITKLQPVMFLEGAIGIDLTTELITTNRIVVQFATGETYASLIRKNTDWFSATSDAQNAYILRDGKRIPINLYPMLYDTSYRDDVQIFENDTLVIPFKQYFVTVAGAVYNPGRYPYLPDRNWEYYIALAGGFVPERNVRQSVTITGMNGKRMKKTDAILPETIVTANTNHGLYYFNQVAPVVTTVLSIVSTLLTINAITR